MGDNFRVSMGFGLHIGWAIEGAIGSEYKIDASYLSPNVNMASRLEAATKQFGTSILMSDDFAMMLSPRCEDAQVGSSVSRKKKTLLSGAASIDACLFLVCRVRKLCRAIDVITVKGSNKPVTLYTYDISLTAIAEPDENKFQVGVSSLFHSPCWKQ
jgi:class 3 adenylate cyclase